MSVKIRISYERDEELEEIKKLLTPMLLNVKVQPPKGKYKRAYINMKNLTKLDLPTNTNIVSKC